MFFLQTSFFTSRRKFKFSFCFLFLILSSELSVSGIMARAAESTKIVPGEFLIKLSQPGKLKSLTIAMGLDVVPHPLLETSTGSWFKVVDVSGRLTEFDFLDDGMNLGVLHAEPNYLWRALHLSDDFLREPANKSGPIPELPPRLPRRPRADPMLGKLWSLEKVGAHAAWKIIVGSDRIVVANIDSGVDYNHEDLVNNIWKNTREIPNDGQDNDGNGFVDDVMGWDFSNKDNLPWDDNGHGSHTAGTLGATGGNGIGISGISKRVSIMPLKFLSRSGSGTTEDAIRAINYAVASGAHILSNSWGGEEYSLALEEAIAEAGAQDVLFVAAAGNDSSDNDSNPMYPASYRLPNVLSVAASDSSDNLADFSNYGVKTVDLSAPGDVIYSTLANGRYSVMSGTSMACPLVAGAAALLKSYKTGLSAVQLKKLLLESVDKIPAFEDKVVSGGRLNVAKALALALEAGQ